MPAFDCPVILFDARRGGPPDAALAFTYSAFTTAPPAGMLAHYQEHPAESAAGLLYHCLDGNLEISAGGRVGIEEEYFPLFRLAHLLACWPRYSSADGEEADILLDDYEHEAKLTVVRQGGFITLRWPVPTRWDAADEGVSRHVISVVSVPEAAFAAASQAFLQQLQADIAEQLDLDLWPLLTPSS